MAAEDCPRRQNLGDRKFEDALNNALEVTELLSAKPKQHQLDVLRHFYNGKDCIGLLPTGYGKSFIFQISPFLYAAKRQIISTISEVKDITLVISPLNSIMKDQVHSLCQRGIPACYLDMCLKSGRTYILRSDAMSDSDSESEDEEDQDEMLQVTATFEAIKKGAYPLIYSHPEALLSTAKGRELLRNIGTRVCCVAVDEAHMIHEWGETFRKDFGRLKQIVVQAKNSTVMLLTATAPPATRQVLVKSLELKDTKFVIGNPDRPNIKYSVVYRGPTLQQHEYLETVLKDLADELKSKRREFPLTIVYTDFDSIIYAIAYMHDALPSGVKYNNEEEVPENLLFNQYHVASTKRSQDDIIVELTKENSKLRLLFATVALGMGLDAKHVRRIIHYKPPTSLERYIQETGRAGRDGQPAKAILHYNATDIRKNRPGIEPSIIQYCTNTGKACLRKMINEHLGASKPPREDLPECTCCSVCAELCSKCEICEM